MATLTRDELYACVWEKPMRTLAKEFGLSDVALHKICRKHKIPTPPVGYWAKLAHGKKVTVTPLPPTTEDHEARIVIHEGAATHESEAMSEARVAVRAALAADANNSADRHPIVERTIAKLRKAKPDRLGLVHSEGVGLVSVRVRSELVERTGMLLDQLVNAAKNAGITIEARSGAAKWKIGAEEVSFELVENADRVEHVATERELNAVAKWKREREEYHRRTGYWRDWGEPKIPKWEDRYQGRLSIELEEVRVRSERSWWGSMIRRKFADRSNRDVAKDVGQVVETIAAIAVAKRENRELEERQRAEAEHRERERIKTEHRRRLEEQRTALLQQLMSKQADVERLKQFVDMLERLPKRAARTEALLRWATQRYARELVLLSPDGLEQYLGERKLFEEAANDADV